MGWRVLEATKLFRKMIVFGCRPDVITNGNLIGGLCRTGIVDDARKLFVSMTSKGCRPDVYSYNILINGYCKMGSRGSYESM
ncbi:Pentatricopeptide repeat protein [Melia azedarach]|uniref:Pentatricopeptide repeat protein n=1 Tax=Melia azedarach TaxID=155640 RepID=A0ACC1XTZ2_MELAZ|nr:Pentatricopeptide repeat protein [Melia azedarach]